MRIIAHFYRIILISTRICQDVTRCLYQVRHSICFDSKNTLLVCPVLHQLISIVSLDSLSTSLNSDKPCMNLSPHSARLALVCSQSNEAEHCNAIVSFSFTASPFSLTASPLPIPFGGQIRGYSTEGTAPGVSFLSTFPSRLRSYRQHHAIYGRAAYYELIVNASTYITSFPADLTQVLVEKIY